jgi:hypothetical protein
LQIQINTDNTIDGNQSLKIKVLEIVEHHLSRFGDRITRIEVHLQDENAQKGGRDIRCRIEARVAGLQPMTVDDLAEDWERASRGASAKMVRVLETRFGKMGRTN